MKKRFFLFFVLIGIFACNSEQPQEQLFDDSVSGTDTLVYFFENSEVKQQLKVVFTSDSTIWYSLGFKNSTGSKLLEGEGIDIYYNLDPEIDDIDGEAQPVLEYEANNQNRGLIIRIDMMEKNFAKVITSLDYQFIEKPKEEILLKR
ncbi:MAG: hypothetical protein KDD29_05155 [Flavobacteriales bacterium]|nr:hypothetical protein [Flavobacteriales bacterium]